MNQRPARATMQDVARLAGVSLATVSHVLNETRYVSPDRVALVRQAIAETGFTPNSLARALAKNSTSSVGLVFSWISNPYFADIIGAIEMECYRAGFSVLLSDTNDDPEKELRIVQDLHERRVDGIFIAPCPDPADRTLAYLRTNKVCTVLVDRLAAPDFDQVGVDNQSAVYQLVDHLAGHGYRDIALLPGHDGYATTGERIAAFSARMAHHGFAATAQIAPPSNSSAAAAAHTSALLSGPAKPQALVTGNNLSTIGAVRAIRQAGLRVPADIALVGIDDFEWADSFEPRLTVIAQPCQNIGKSAAKMMHDRIKSPLSPVRTLQLKPKLIYRDSCGCKTEL